MQPIQGRPAQCGKCADLAGFPLASKSIGTDPQRRMKPAPYMTVHSLSTYPTNLESMRVHVRAGQVETCMDVSELPAAPGLLPKRKA